MGASERIKKQINNAKVCVGACIERANGDEQVQYLLMYKPKKGFWEFPGGKIEIGETLTEGLKREVREETGLEITVGRVQDLFSYPNKEGNSTVYMQFSATTDYSKSDKIKLSVEHSESQWVTWKELMQAKNVSPIIKKWLAVSVEEGFNAHIYDTNISDD